MRLNILLPAVLFLFAGQGVSAFGQPGSEKNPPVIARVAPPPTATSLAYPQSLYIDSQSGNIWVADFDNNRVLRFDVSTLTEVTSPVARKSEKYALAQNYPNPFNPGTTITFVLKATEFATVIVYDVLGREVETLFRGIATAGRQYTLSLNATTLPSGIYLYALRSGTRNEVKKMSVIK